jgi:hypothetical protein
MSTKENTPNAAANKTPPAAANSATGSANPAANPAAAAANPATQNSKQLKTLGEISDAGSASGGSKSLATIVKGFSFTGSLLEGVFTVASGGTFGILSVIMFILRIIAYLLYYIIVKIIPFLVMYIGIPTFILGAIMGLFFLGGHILFLVVFFAGLFLYLKNIYKVVYNLPKNISNNNNNMSSNTKSIKVKAQN